MIGGGIAGMVAALDLAHAGFAVDLLEADDRLGGKLRAVQVGGVRVDVGPDAFVARRPEGVDLCQEVGVAHELVAPGVAGAALWARGRLRALPAGLVLGVPTNVSSLARSGIVGPAGVVRAATDRWRGLPASARRSDAPGSSDRSTFSGEPSTVARTDPPAAHDRSVGELVEPRLGHRVTSRLVDPLVGGIHAGPISALSAETVFPALLAASQRSGGLMRNLAAVAGSAPPPTRASPVFLTLRTGMAGLASQVQRSLVDSGASIRLGTPVQRLAPGVGGGAPRWQVVTDAGTITVDGVVLAVSAQAAARLLGDDIHAGIHAGPRGTGAGAWDADGGAWDAARRRLARALGALDYATVNVVTFAFDPEGPARRWRRAPGTGFLVPAEQGLLTTGGTWLSAKWPDVHPDGPVLVRLSAGRHGDERSSRLDDRALVQRLLGELRAVAGDVDDPLDAVVTRWPDAFPQYRVGHRAWALSTASLADALPALVLAGAAYDGVGVPACIGSGHRAARLLAERLHRAQAPRDQAPRDEASRDEAPRDQAPRDQVPRDEVPRDRSRGQLPDDWQAPARESPEARSIDPRPPESSTGAERL